MVPEPNTKVSEETKALRLRLITLLSLYDLLPSALEDNLDADFDCLPTLDSATDIESVLRSLNCIAEKLRLSEASTTAILTSLGVKNALQVQQPGPVTSFDAHSSSAGADACEYSFHPQSDRRTLSVGDGGGSASRLRHSMEFQAVSS